MIVSVTLNPALYLDYTAGQVRLGELNKVPAARHRAAGRGLAVARLLQTFGHEVTAAGLAGGASGELIREELSRAGVPASFTRTGAESRRVIRVTDGDGTVTTFAEPAPYITTEELGRLAGDYRDQLAGADAVVLCGGLPAGLPSDIYGSLTSYAAAAGVPVILAADGDELRHAAGRGPALVIPETSAGAQSLQFAGPVVVSSGSGTRVQTPAGQWQAELKSGPGGAGDRPPGQGGADLDGFRAGLVAGFVPGIALGWSWPDMLRHALALAASADGEGAVDLGSYESLLQNVTVQKLSAGNPPYRESFPESS